MKIKKVLLSLLIIISLASIACDSFDIDADTYIVYVTETGTKYHSGGCRYLWNSKIPITLSEARLHYSPCSVCDPPD